MASIFRIMGHAAGRALKHQAVNTAVRKTSSFMYREMALADIKLKLRLLEKKRAHHIRLLGRTVYRLTSNDIPPLDDSHTQTIVRVLREIDLEIGAASEELARRNEQKTDSRP